MQSVLQEPFASSAAEDCWRFLYRTAAIAALLRVALFLFQIFAFFVWPPPSTVAGHFALRHARPLVGLVSLDFVIIVDEVLGIPILLALYLSLHRVHESWVLIATGLSVVSTVCFISGNPSLNMLYLSQQYAAATTATARDGLLGAGQAVLSSWQGTPYQVAYVTGMIAMLIISCVMLRSLVFSQFTALCGNRRQHRGLWPLCTQDRRLYLDPFRRGDANLVRDDRADALTSQPDRSPFTDRPGKPKFSQAAHLIPG